MELLDWVVIAGYFALLGGIAWWVILKSKDTADDYFLAGRNLSWWIVGASIFASNIGSEHLVGLAGSGCSDGVAMAHYELHAWCLLVLAWVFVPFYMRSKVFTMPEFLERRFSPSARWVLSIISLVAYVLTKIAVGIFAGGIVFSVLLPDIAFLGLDSFWIGSILVIVLTGAYTVLGGLRAVAYTEAVQTIVLVAGSVLVTVYGLIALGGWSEFREVCGSEMFNLWKPLVPEGMEGTWAPVKEEGQRIAWYFNGNYPWLGMLFCAPIIGLWYWCTDQYIVQRTLGAPSEQEARRGSIFAAMLKLLPVFIFIIPGMISMGLMVKAERGEIEGMDFGGMMTKEEVVDAPPSTEPPSAEPPSTEPPSTEPPREIVPPGETVEQTRERLRTTVTTVGDSGKAFPMMVANVLPVGLRGLVVAGLLAALMSSLSGVFNASSTLFTMDFYSKLRPNVSQKQLVWTGRVATTAMVVIGLAWIPVIKGSHGLYDYLQSVQGYLAPPIFVVFFLGVFMKRMNSRGCLAALIVGFALGVFRLAIDTPVSLKLAGFENGYTEGSFFWIVNNIYFQYYSLVIFLVCVAVMVVVSYLSAPPQLDRISGLTYGTITDEHRAESRSSWGAKDIIASIAVLVAILAAYLYFNG